MIKMQWTCTCSTAMGANLTLPSTKAFILNLKLIINLIQFKSMYRYVITLTFISYEICNSFKNL